MAKGNMLQGMARGKVGDVVFSRLNGEQIARVRNRNPKNPKTNAQLYQRAIMATVMAGYSAGKAIFDHAFQGLSVGEANQRRFMSQNAKRLRGILASDLKAVSDENRSVSSFNAPGVSAPAPALLQISEGNYPQNAFVSPVIGMVDPDDEETVAQYAQRLGLVEGDIYTIVGFACDTTDPVFNVRTDLTGEAAYPATQFSSVFYYARLRVKTGLSAITTPVTIATTIATFFEVTDTFNCSVDTEAPIQDEGRREWLHNTIETPGSLAVAGIIRSRENEDLRSTSYMESVTSTSYYNPATMYGLSAKYLLQGWKQGTEQVGDSDLILEGGDQ